MMVNFKVKLFVITFITLSFSSYPLFLTENTSNIIDVDKDFSTLFFKKIDSVSLEIDYYGGDDNAKSEKVIVTNKFSTHIHIDIPKDDIAFWNGMFFNGVYKIAKKDTSKIPFTIGKIITFVLKVKIYHNNKTVEIYYPPWGVKDGCGRLEVSGVLHFIFFKKDNTIKFKEHLIKLLDYTIQKDFINSEFN